MTKSPAEYQSFLENLKRHIQTRQVQAMLTANSQLLYLYWELGHFILQQQSEQSWGTKVIDQLASDLKLEFPSLKGLSARNLKYMRKFAKEYNAVVIVQQVVAQIGKDDIEKDKKVESVIVQQVVAQLDNEEKNSPKSIVQQAAAQLENINFGEETLINFSTFNKHIISKLPWGHLVTLMDKTPEMAERQFYAQKAFEESWSRNVLINKIETKLFHRKGALSNNFATTLSLPQNDLAREIFHDPYLFQFLKIDDTRLENELENGLISNLQKFLLEMGKGFAFLGKQFHLPVEGEDFYVDLLFFHTHLNCHVVIELKVGAFKPDYVGQLNFYVNAVNGLLKRNHHNPTIGLLLVKENNKVIAQYSLEGLTNPIGIARYQLSEDLPTEKQLQEVLQRPIGQIVNPQ